MSRLRDRWADLKGLGRVARYLPRTQPNAPWNAARLLAEHAERAPDDLGLAYLDRRYSWSEIDREVNRAARAFQALGIEAGDSVPLLMDNRPEFLFALTGLSRLRASAALINTNITGAALAHALRVAEPKCALVGAEHAAKLGPALAELDELAARDVLVQSDSENPDTGDEGFASFDALTAQQSDARPEGYADPVGTERMCFIYTSGTTGLPKAAIISNRRFLTASALFAGGLLEARRDDVIYITLPLYHSNAMFGGWGSALHSGAAIALRRKFSASRFWEDVRSFEATSFVYIGELCRYLLNQPEHADERRHKLRLCSGNGLRPDIWERFQERFAVPIVREFYGATEGNSAIANFAGRPGMLGRLLPGMAVLRCDPETGEPERDAKGLCRRVDPGESGLLAVRINRFNAFDGYADRKATQKKILENVFKPGDQYFNSGDLITLHEGGWAAFADRIGDTFRWKGENVSTNEVAELLNGAPGVLESNVYGVEVPGSEGRAGMASLNVDDSFSLEQFNAFVLASLPGYQRPYFVRLQHDMRITGTFKHQKVDYRKEGYDPAKVKDPLYFLDGEKYVPLDAALYEALRSGEVSPR